MAVNFTRVEQREGEWWRDCWYVTDETSRYGLFMPPSDDNPQSLTLKQSWNDYTASIYVFFPDFDAHNEPTEEFINELIYLRNRPEHSGTRFLWLEQAITPDQPYDFWHFLSFIPGEYGLETDRAFAAPYAQFDIFIGKTCPIVFQEAHDQFVIQCRDKIGDNAKPDHIPTESIALLMEDHLLPAQSHLTIAMDGVNQGELDFSFDLFDIAPFNMQLRVYFPQVALAKDDTPRDHIAFPIFNNQTDDDDVPVFTDVHLQFKAGDHLNPDFKFGKDAGATRSFYRTIHGHWIKLQPAITDDKSQMPPAGFTNITRTIEQDGLTITDSHYIPYGHYLISIDRANPNIEADDRLLCGLSGMEYISLKPKAENVLHFKKEQPAYADTFNNTSKSKSSKTESRLGNNFVTSWVRVEQWDKGNTINIPIYYAQPELAPFYGVSENTNNNAATEDSSVLTYHEVALADIDDNKEESFVPLMPFGGIDRSLRYAVQRLEQQIINPTRRTQFSEVEKLLANDTTTIDFDTVETIRTTTPHGMLIDFTTDYKNIDKLIFAEDTKDNQIGFHSITSEMPLRAAVQSNQLFMVMSDRTQIASNFGNQNNTRTTTPATTISFTDWTFDITPSNNSWLPRLDEQGQTDESGPNADTILIFKYFDKPLIDLVEDASLWTLGHDYNENLSKIQRKLLRQLRSLVEQAENDMAYAYIRDVITNKHWSGVIALNVSIDGDGFPKDLQGLLSDPQFANKVHAAYVVVETTPISIEDKTIKADQSALYALIDYKGKPTPATGENPPAYEFYVSRLRARFANAKLVEFAADIVVTVNTLFKEAVQLVDASKPEAPTIANRNDLYLTGRREKHGDDFRYTFSFNGNNRFLIAGSSVLQDVTIVRASFASSVKGTDENKSISSRFTFWGQMNFAPPDDLFDPLSFGYEAPADATTEDEPVKALAFAPPPAAEDSFLSFANLGLNMLAILPVTTQNDVTFAIDERSLVLNLADSKPRSDSIFNKFPLKFNALRSSDVKDSTTPLDINTLGFMTVSTPLAIATPPAGDWYGIVYQMELGNLGALAGNKVLTAEILAAWSPGQEGVYIGFRLPGSVGGKKEIAIQGILKITFSDIIFSVAEVPSANNPQITVPAYSLRLRDVKLKLLVLSLPIEGKAEIMIFADPDAQQGESLLGWYAAYAKEATVKLNQPDGNNASGKKTRSRR